MGNDHDRGELTDFVPDAAARLCAVLLAQGCPGACDDTAYIPWHHPVRSDPGRGVCNLVAVHVHRDDRTGSDPEPNIKEPGEVALPETADPFFMGKVVSAGFVVVLAGYALRAGSSGLLENSAILLP